MNKVLNTLILFTGAFLFLTAGPQIERYIFPVKTDFKVLEAEVVGDDVIVTTSSVKHRSCEFKGTRVRTDDGIHLPLKRVTDQPPINWVADEGAQISVPWRVVGGADEHLHFYQEFQCHSLWKTFQELGEYEGDK